MHVINGIPLGSPLLLPVGTVNSVETLKAEGMPKVSYLTYLDQYVLVAFSLLFLITVGNVVVSSGYGIPDTVADPRISDFWWKNVRCSLCTMDFATTPPLLHTFWWKT
jgi:hypothetical protein